MWGGVCESQSGVMRGWGVGSVGGGGESWWGEAQADPQIPWHGLREVYCLSTTSTIGGGGTTYGAFVQVGDPPLGGGSPT